MADRIQAQAFAAIKGRETTSGRVTAFSELDCRAVGSLRALAMAMAGFFFLDKLWTPTFGCCAWGDIGNGRHAADSPRMVNSQANKHNGAITACGCPNEGGNGGQWARPEELALRLSAGSGAPEMQAQVTLALLAR